MVREYKIIVLGNEGVGKSSILLQFIQGIFVTKYDPTIEDSYRKIIEINGTQYFLEILDTAGGTQTPLRDLFIKDSNGFVLVYAINSKSSFNELPEYRDHILRVKDTDNFNCILVGNKSDLEDERTVSTEELKQVGSRWRNTTIESSAKLNHNITKLFEDLIRPYQHESRVREKESFNFLS